MERLYCQGVVATAYGRWEQGRWKMGDLYKQTGLRPKAVIGEGRMAIKGFNVRGVSIATTTDPETVREKLEEVANAAIVEGKSIGKRQQILDDWIQEQNNV